MRVRLSGATVGAWAGFVVSAALLVLLARAVDFEALGAALQNADTRLIVLAVMPFFFSVWIRSIRHRMLLPGRLPGGSLFRIQIVGFALNNLLPARAGDIARAYLLSRWCQVAYGTTAASLVVERILDGLTLALILLIALLFLPAPGYLMALAAIAAAGFLVLTGIVALAVVQPGLTLSVTSLVAGRLPGPARRVVQRLGGSFAHGLTPLRSLRRVPLLLGLSLLGWAGQFALFYIVMLAFPAAASVGATLVAAAVANFATLIPASPASVGTFDGALVKVLVDVANMSADRATAYALVVHGALFVPIILVGMVVLSRANLSLSQVLSVSAKHLPATSVL